MTDKTQINYSLEGKILPNIDVTINYSRRLADNYEGVLPGFNNDHLTSVTSKNFLVMEFDSSEVNSNTVQLNGLNNLWLDTKTKKLTI